MSCSPHDLRDYVFKELDSESRRQVESHLKTCAACRLETDRLLVTEAAMHSLRDEEIPRRIAFVSDKIFEPSLLHRWWRAGWVPTGALIAAAIIFAALYRPQPVIRQAPFDAARLRAEISQEVVKAVTASEQRSAQRTAEILAAAEKRFEFERRADRLAFAENLEYVKKQLNVLYVASNDRGAPR